MITHIIKLSDGTEIASGLDNEPTHLRSVEIQRMVNSDDELTVGSVCSASMTAVLITPGGNLSVAIAENAPIRVFSVDENGTRKKEGRFILQKPTRVSQNTYKLVAYDYISKLDKDLTRWLSRLTGWPYEMRTFANMVCQKCGLTLKNQYLPDQASSGLYNIPKFTLESVTGRMLITYIAEICGKFVRATIDGEVEFAWYTLRSDISVKPTDGQAEVAYRINSLSYEDYAVQPIEQLVAYVSAEGAFKVIKTVGGTEVVPADFAIDPDFNTYFITDNPILLSLDQGFVDWITHTFESLSTTTYTPAKCDLFRGSGIEPGDLVDITDANGVTIRTAVMSKTISRGIETISSTGSSSRQSSSNIYSRSYQRQQEQIEQGEKQRESTSIKRYETRAPIKNAYVINQSTWEPIYSAGTWEQDTLYLPIQGL